MGAIECENWKASNSKVASGEEPLERIAVAGSTEQAFSIKVYSRDGSSSGNATHLSKAADSCESLFDTPM